MIGGGCSLESPTKFYNKFSIIKINDIFKMEVAKKSTLNLLITFHPNFSQ